MNDKPTFDIEAGKGLKNPKVLVVGNYGEDMSSIVKAARLAGEGSVIVVDSETKPMLDPKDLKEADNFIRTMACLESFAGPLPRPRRKVEHLSKCGLPSCNVMSKKDYCCAEHCKQHKKMKYIRNVKDATQLVLPLTCAPCMGGDSECVVCDKKMPFCWEKACWLCGDTLCNSHVTEYYGRHYCPSCAKKEKKI